MKTDVLPKIQQDLWAKLAGVKGLTKFYLAGGTAVALHLGHRESIDFDFFSPDPFNTQNLLGELSKLGNLEIKKREEETLLTTTSNVQVGFFQYPYPLVGPLHPISGLAVADLKDLSAMKIIAIGQRGAKKDFIDLHALLQTGWNLEAIFQCVDQKYTKERYNKIHLLKSLTYFDDAEDDPMPKMRQPISWQEIRRNLEIWAQTYIR